MATDDKPRCISCQMAAIWQSLFYSPQFGDSSRFATNVMCWLAKQGSVTLEIMHDSVDDCDTFVVSGNVRGAIGPGSKYSAPDETLAWALIGAVKTVQCIQERIMGEA